MPKMRGFMRGKPKIDDAEWAIAQMRTAARLGDLFPTDEAAAKEKEARDKANGVDAATDLSTIVVGPGPWSGGPRPPIVVVGVSEVASVLPKTGPVQPIIISAVPPTVDPAAAEPVPTPAEPGPAPADPVVVVAAEPVAVDETLSPAKPIGRATTGDGGPKVTGVMAEPHDVSPAKPIGVMARVGDPVGDDTWRLPEATPPPVPAFVRAAPTPALPPAAHVFAKQQRHEAHGDDDLASLVRPKPAGGPAVRTTSDSAPPSASATAGRVPRTRPVVARALAEGSAGTTALPARRAPAARPRSRPASAARRGQAARPVAAEPIKRAAAPRAAAPEVRPAPKNETEAKPRLETKPAAPPAAKARLEAESAAPPAPAAKARLESATAAPKVRPAKPAAPPVAKAKARLEPTPAARPAAKARPATKARSGAKARSKGKTRSVPAAAPTAYCPYCAKLLDPAPTTSRRCDRCRQRIVVKRIDGTAVYLTEAAVLVFEAERRRVMASVRWARDRDRWLQHAAAAGAPAERMAQLAVARLSADVVSTARKLYLNTVDRSFRTARNEHDWDEASRLRRDQAAVLYRFAGSPTQPPDEVVALFREGVAAELRGVSEIARDAELVSARCCDTCRGDDRLVVKITTELRAPRLPHAGCPRGLCRCHWDLATKDRLTMRRYLRRRPAAELRLAQSREDEAPAATSVPAGQDQVG